MTPHNYLLLADCVLVIHTSLVLFVVGGLPLIIAGNLLDWRWVNGWRFRSLHLATIAVVVAESWLGFTCPLTTLESWLRAQGGGQIYGESFIEHWLQAILFYRAPSWVFTLVYTLFAACVAGVWWYFPPRKRARSKD